MIQVTVREHARLTTGSCKSHSLREAQISETAFDYLCALASTFKSNGAMLLQVEDRKWLKLDSYVGVIETPCGTRLEILPKHISTHDGAVKSRQLLCKMLERALDLPSRDAGEADLQLFKQPLHEWVIRQFLVTFEVLIKKGLRFDYQRIEEEQKFLRGQLDVAQRMRQPVGREHIFPIRHDIFTPDRAENRLLRAALERICRVTKDGQNWRLAQELRLLTCEIPTSRQIQQDFQKWQSGRLLAHYQAVHPWCKLVLGQYMPMTVQGDWHGMSLLFPMEKLFEEYVASCLSESLVAGASLSTQVKAQHLCNHHANNETKPRKRFRLIPDLLIRHKDKNTVLDTKWKLLDIKATRYDLKDSDFHQMFAYSHFYLNHQGNVILIYPYCESFKKALPVFEFRNTVASNLWVVPFDLEEDVLMLSEEMTNLGICWLRSNQISVN